MKPFEFALPRPGKHVACPPQRVLHRSVKARHGRPHYPFRQPERHGLAHAHHARSMEAPVSPRIGGDPRHPRMIRRQSRRRLAGRQPHHHLERPQPPRYRGYLLWRASLFRSTIVFVISHHRQNTPGGHLLVGGRNPFCFGRCGAPPKAIHARPTRGPSNLTQPAAGRALSPGRR